VLQSSLVDYSKSLLLYQEDVAQGLPLKLTIMVVPAALAAASIYLWSSGESAGGLALLAEAVCIGLIFLAVFPRRYQVYEDHLRIVLGGPFAVRIGFDRIARIEVTSKTALTINLVTRIAKTYVRIVRKSGFGIAITPKSNDGFVENGNRALSEWARARGIEPQRRRMP